MTDVRKLIPAGIFGDGMILQRDKESRVFGKADGEVAVTLDDIRDYLSVKLRNMFERYLK